MGVLAAVTHRVLLVITIVLRFVFNVVMAVLKAIHSDLIVLAPMLSSVIVAGMLTSVGSLLLWALMQAQKSLRARDHRSRAQAEKDGVAKPGASLAGLVVAVIDGTLLPFTLLGRTAFFLARLPLVLLGFGGGGGGDGGGSSKDSSGGGGWFGGNGKRPVTFKMRRAGTTEPWRVVTVPMERRWSPEGRLMAVKYYAAQKFGVPGGVHAVDTVVLVPDNVVIVDGDDMKLLPRKNPTLEVTFRIVQEEKKLEAASAAPTSVPPPPPAPTVKTAA